ncbi:unnamed protein product [Blepharisma stoltei]|uniref:Aminotransferase class I/classII large domain-containing protein n=1 Tax=Blepharisma stoltei TaxID=1481888 RepID=A0AAU9JQD6_9CILI|nr:unnamed protein product [Blepharisma stoltei]
MANAVPQILSSMPEQYSEDIAQKLKIRADIVPQKLSNLNELYITPTEGLIYSMILIDPNAFQDIPTSSVFVDKLAAEESVSVMPAEVYLSTNGFRIVLCNSIMW